MRVDPTSGPGGVTSSAAEPGPKRVERRLGPERARSRVVDWLSGAVQLSSDRRRQGADAFTASPFNRLAVTHAISMAGDALVTLALAGSLFFNISPHAARGRVALSLVLTMAPFAVVAPFLGPVIDRTKGGRRLMVLLTAGGRTVACLFMARYIHSLLLFPAAFVTLVCSKAYVVAKAALVPAAVERPEDLIEANAKLAVGGAIVGFLAAIPGVAILKLLSAATLLRVDCVVFIVCGVSALRIRPARPAPAAPPGLPGAEGTLGGGSGPGSADPGTGSGPDHRTRSGPDQWPGSGPLDGAATTDGALATPRPLPAGVLQLAAAAVGSLRFSVGFLTFLVAFAFRRSGAPAWWYGVVLAASVGGNLVGAVIAPRLRGRVREEHILAGAVAAVALTGVVAMQLSAFHSYPAAALMAAMLGVGAGAAKLAFDSLVQREVPAAVQGRAFARFEAMFQLVWVVGGLVPVLIAMSLQAGFVVGTVVTTAAVVTYEMGSWLGRRDRLPGWWPGTAGPARWPAAAGEETALGGAVGLAAPGRGSGAPAGTGPGPVAGLGRPGPGGPAGPWPEPELPRFGPAGPRPIPPPLSGPPPVGGLGE